MRTSQVVPSEHDRLFKKYEPMIRKAARRQSSLNNDSIEDAFQDGCLKFMHTLRSWDPSRASFPTLLYMNLNKRKAHKQGPVYLDIDPDSTPSNRHNQERALLLKEAICRLSLEASLISKIVLCPAEFPMPLNIWPARRAVQSYAFSLGINPTAISRGWEEIKELLRGMGI